MELNKKQKEFVLKLAAEGLQSDEINTRAEKFKPAFSVSRQQVDFYRKSRNVKIKEIAESGEMDALKTGLALRAERIVRLAKLAERIEQDLTTNGLLWLKRERALGSGIATKFVLVEEFNSEQVATFRHLLDDIAKEMNARVYERRESLNDQTGISSEDLSELTDEELHSLAKS